MAVKHLKFTENLKTEVLIWFNQIKFESHVWPVAAVLLDSAVLAILMEKYERRHKYC